MVAGLHGGCVDGFCAAGWVGGGGLQSVVGYLGLALVFVWNGALRERFNCCFFGDFLLALVEFSFWWGELGTELSFYGV